MGLDRLWAGWRSEYVSDPDTGREDKGCALCNLAAATDDVEALVLERTPTTIAVMNLYPYGSGHLMVAPIRHVASYEDLTDDEHTDLAFAQRRALVAIRAAYGPDGVNIGANLGRAAGAGIPGHLHVHLLPRWNGDTNFMPVIGEVSCIPEHLEAMWARLAPVFAELEK